MPFRRDDDERHTLFSARSPVSLSLPRPASVDREPYITISFYITMPLHASVDEEALDRASRSTERPHICGDGTAISQSDFVNEPSEGVHARVQDYRYRFPTAISARACARARRQKPLRSSAAIVAANASKGTPSLRRAGAPRLARGEALRGALRSHFLWRKWRTGSEETRKRHVYYVVHLHGHVQFL